MWCSRVYTKPSEKAFFIAFVCVAGRHAGPDEGPERDDDVVGWLWSPKDDVAECLYLREDNLTGSEMGAKRGGLDLNEMC